MKKIAFFNRKGGTGKTTTTCNLASAFCLKKKKVLVVDCDSQMTASNYLLSHTPERNEYGLREVLNGENKISETLTQIWLKEEDEKSKISLYVCSSSTDIEQTEMEDETVLANALKEVESEFDYCFFDLPPNLNSVSLAALVASDFVIVPALCDTDSLSGYDLLLDIVSNIRSQGLNPSLKVLGILVSNYSKMRAVQKFVLNSLRDNMGDLVFKTTIKSASIVEQARYMGVPLPYFVSSKNEIAIQYADAAKELEKKILKMSKS